MAKKYEILLASFGMTALRPYTFFPGQTLQGKAAEYPKQQITVEETNYTSWLGTPVFSPLILSSQDGELSIRIDTALIDVTRSKNMVRTELAGRDGTFKELISDSDYYVVIKGGIFSESDIVYPTEQVKTLIRLLDLKETLKASSPFLQLFGEFDLAVSQRKFEQKKGSQNYQLFEIRALSDTPIELLEVEE